LYITNKELNKKKTKLINTKSIKNAFFANIDNHIIFLF